MKTLIVNRKIIVFILLTVSLIFGIQGMSHGFFGGIIGAIVDIGGAIGDVVGVAAEGIGAVFVAAGKVVEVTAETIGIAIRAVGVIFWHTDSLHSLEIFPNGGIIGVVVSNFIHLWEPSTGQTNATFTHNAAIRSIAVSPDGAMLASASEDGNVLLWDPNTATFQNIFRGHTDKVLDVAFSPDGTLLASASEDDTVRLWDPHSKILQGTLRGHTDDVLSAAFNSDGTQLVSASADGTVRVWDANTHTLQKTLTEHTDRVLDLAFSQNGKRFASASADGTVRVWDANTHTLQKTFDHELPVYSIAFSPDREILASGSSDGAVRLLDLDMDKVIAKLGHESPVRNVAFSPDGSMLYSTSEDGNMRQWEIASENTPTQNTQKVLDSQQHNVLIYTGDVRWINQSDAIAEAETTKKLLQSTGIDAEITKDEHYVKQWMLQTTSNGSVNVLILYGLIPSIIYPPRNAMSDGSVAENWIETTDGNTILNHADYIGFWGTGNTSRGDDGHVGNYYGTLRNLMDNPDIFIPTEAPSASMFVTSDGSTLTPSLVDFESDRPIPLDQLQGDWFAEKILASNTGNAQAALADPVVLRDGNRGRIAIVHQTAFKDNPKGEVAAEIIINYLIADLVVTPPITDATVKILPASVVSLAVGEQLEISLNITGGEAIAGYQATVRFDDTALHYVESSNSDYLPDGAFFAPPIEEKNLVKLNAASLAGEVSGDGTLATLIFEAVAVKPSTLTLSNVLLTNSAGTTSTPHIENAEIIGRPGPEKLTSDVNGDGTVNIGDLVLVASNLGKTGQNAADVNGDAVVNIADLVLVAGALGTSAAAPSLHLWSPEMLTAADVKQWLSQAQLMNLTDAASQRGIQFLERLLAALTPKETTLLANYPNPFNPETWIPYRLAKSADVTLTIYAIDGQVVRRLALGHQPAGMYQNRSRAAHWDGRNAFGEPVASGVYFYTITAGDFTATRKMLIRK